MVLVQVLGAGRMPSLLRASQRYQLVADGGYSVCNLLGATVF